MYKFTSNLNKKEMLNIVGGASWTSSWLNAISKAVTTLMDLGRSLGTSIRRSISGKVCSL